MRPPINTARPRFARARRVCLSNAVFAAFLATTLCCHSVHAHTPAEAMAEAAERLLESLDDNQRQQISFSFEDAERTNWNFVPMERKGLPLKNMQQHQRQLAFGLLSSAVSHRGFTKAVNIMALEQILHEMEDNSPRRDPGLYHFYIFGTPSTEKTWGWRVEGHHLSLSLTLVDGQQVVGTPAFLGANPAHVKHGPHEGLRVLEAEEDLARQLLHSLDDAQRKVAVVSTDAPADVINGPGKDAEPLSPMGLAAKDLTKEQRAELMTLVREYVHTYRPELAREDMKKIREAGVGQIYFAWAGGDQPGDPHYYRIQGPTFILEYDNTQNDANHVHVVWRDFKNDFGANLLKQHYQTVPHGDQ